jgi:hypothetical protein
LANLGFSENQRSLPAEAAGRRRGYAAARRLQGPREPTAPMRRSSRNEGKEHITYDADALFRQMTREEKERETQEVRAVERHLPAAQILSWLPPCSGAWPDVLSISSLKTCARVDVAPVALSLSLSGATPSSKPARSSQ